MTTAVRPDYLLLSSAQRCKIVCSAVLRELCCIELYHPTFIREYVNPVSRELVLWKVLDQRFGDMMVITTVATGTTKC
eukprot:2613496-Pyramimonas_sp.AAC.2